MKRVIGIRLVESSEAILVSICFIRDDLSQHEAVSTLPNVQSHLGQVI